MPPAPYNTRALNHGFSLLYGQYFVALERIHLSSGRLYATSAFKPGWTWRPKSVQQRRFATNKDEGSSNNDKRPTNKNQGWYDWYARLHADPKASVKDLRKAFYKRAKVEHPDHDKTPGAKARFQNLQETFENLCDESKRNEHDQQRLARQKAAAARMMASQPSVADSLRAKWKAEEEALRKAEDTRTREARKSAQMGQQPAKPSSKPHGPGVDSQKPRGPKTENSEEAPRKEQQQQEQAQGTENDRFKKQKTAEDRLAKKQAAAEKKRREDAAAETTRQNNLLQERVIVIRDLPPGTELVDLFKPLVKLTPGPVFSAKLWCRRTAEVEFCTATAARTVLTLARMRRLFIKGELVTSVGLCRSLNRLPVTGTKSRVLRLGRTLGAGVYRNAENLEDFLKRHGLQVERTVKDGSEALNSTTVLFASWAEAERARKLLTRHMRGLNVSYWPDPCESNSDSPYGTAADERRSYGSESSQQKPEEKSGKVADALGEIVVVLILALVVWLAHQLDPTTKPWRRRQRPSPMFDYQRQMIKLIKEANEGKD